MNEYIIDAHYDLITLKRLSYSVSKRKADGSGRYEHCGYMFENFEDAMNWINGIWPKRYLKINWDLFPADTCYEVIFEDSEEAK